MIASGPPWNRKPPCGTRIDPLHPLARGLVAAWPFNEGNGVPRNALSGAQATSNSMAWTPATSRGLALSNTAAANYVKCDEAALNISGQGITLAAWVYPTSASNYQLLIGYMNGGTRQYALFLAPSTGSFYIALNGVFAGALTLSIPWSVNAWNHCAVTKDGHGDALYLNGVQVNSGFFTNPITTVAGSSLYMGYDFGSSSFGINGQLDAPMIWNRALSAGEVASLYSAPFGMFRPLYSWPGGGAVLPSAFPAHPFVVFPQFHPCFIED